ncbi:MAG: DUF4340 domain-containing protein [Chloroflexota bacterium]
MTGNRLKITPINVALVVLMLIQLGAIALLYWPSAEATESSPLLGELSAEDINELVVTNDSENSLRLVQTGSGWVLADRDNFPANPTKVEEIVDKLVAMETNRLVTQTDASHNRLQVAADSFAGKIDITIDGEKQTVYVGSAPSTGATHVRLDGESATYLTDGIAAWELNPQISSWIDTLYFETDRNTVTEFRLTNANGDFTFARENADSGWTQQGLLMGSLDDTEVNTLLGRVVNIRMREPLGKSAQPDYGMDAPLATVTLITTNTGSDGTEGASEAITIELGATDDEGNYAMKSSGSEYYVSVAAFTGDALVEATQDGFLAEEEEPAPTPEPVPTEEPVVEPTPEPTPEPTVATEGDDAQGDDAEENDEGAAQADGEGAAAEGESASDSAVSGEGDGEGKDVQSSE